MGLLNLMGSTDFNPRAELFANGEVGLVADIGDLTTLYQDSNGVTRAASVGDPVGLIIDRSKGGLDALSATNLFDSTGSVSVSAGVTQTGTSNDFTMVSAVANTSAIALDVGMIANAGKWYKVTYEIYDYVSGSISARIQGVSKTTRSGNGIYEEIHLGITSGDFIGIGIISTATLKVRNISVREIPGHHIYQATSGSRPALSRVPMGGRRNLLVESERLDQASWSKNSISITANAATSPSAISATADLIVEDGTTNPRGVAQSQTCVAGVSYAYSLWAKSNGRDMQVLVSSTFASSGYANFDLTNGVVGSKSANVESTISSGGNGWYLCTVTFTSAGSGGGNINVNTITGPTAARSESYTGDSASGIYVDMQQFEVGNSRSNYQRTAIAGTVVDCTESGVPDCWYLDTSSNKWMQTAAIDFTGTDEMTVIAGVRKFSDASYGVIIDLTTNPNSINGAFTVGSSTLTGDASRRTYGAFYFRTNLSGKGGAIFASPTTNVVAALFDVSQSTADTQIAIRVNGVVPATNVTGASATGGSNFANAAMYFGARAGSSSQFNGHLFSFIIRGKTTSGSKLTRAEKYIAKKTGLSI